MEKELYSRYPALEECRDAIEAAREAWISCYEQGGKLLICGNGGSCADASHIVGELMKGFLKKRPVDEAMVRATGCDRLQRGLPAIDLTAQGAVISAINNDLGGECVYAQQVLAYGREGDVLLGSSTSGNAKNVLMAMRAARQLGMHTAALTGLGGGKMGEEADLLLDVPEKETYRVQEEHIRLYHQLCARVEAHFFEK